MQTHFMPDRQFSKFLIDRNDSTSAQIVINHQRQKTVIQHEEITDYGFVQFLSDTGGIITKKMSFFSILSQSFLKKIFFRYCWSLDWSFFLGNLSRCNWTNNSTSGSSILEKEKIFIIVKSAAFGFLE